MNVFFENLPQVPRELNSVLSNAALQNMECNKGPGIDGLPVEFHKTFWSEVSLDLLQVLNESLVNGQLTLYSSYIIAQER